MEDPLAFPGLEAYAPPVLAEDPPAAPAPALQIETSEPEVVREALARGADVNEIVELLLRRRFPSALRTSSGRVLEMSGELRDDFFDPRRLRADPFVPLREALTSIVAAEWEAHRVAVDAEFATLQRHVQASFAPLSGESFATAEQKYLALRGVYYRNGWRCPKQQIFDHIVAPGAGARFLGYPIQGGAHEELVAVLARVTDALNAARPGLTDRVGEQIFTIGGFVPRYVAGSTTLSNHAFGLALDIDPDWNPQFKSKAALNALKRATGLDFGQAILPASQVDRLDAVYRRIQDASDRLKAWLARVLPQWETQTAGLKALRQKVQQAMTAQERKDARDALAVAEAAFRGDADLVAVDTLMNEFGERTVRAWAAYGIQTIPAELIRVFKQVGSSAGARWGGEYDTSKDGMHLELLAERVIRRDGPRVKDLTDLEGGRIPAPPVCR